MDCHCHIVRPLEWFLGFSAVLAVGLVLWVPYAQSANEPVSVERKLPSTDRLSLHTCGTNCLSAQYPGGQIKSHANVSNGVLEGLSEGWYSNGVRQVQEYFHAGVSQGLRVKWHTNGNKSSEANIVNGKIEGVFRRWYDSGALAEEITMKNNQPDGEARSFYPSGCLKARAELKDGKVISQRYWEDGENPSDRHAGESR